MPEQDVALSTTRAASVRSRPAVRRRLTVILGGLAILVFAFGMVWLQTDKRYKLMGVPETYIIDQNGVLREKVIGPRDWTRRESIETIVRMLQKQPKSVKAD